VEDACRCHQLRLLISATRQQLYSSSVSPPHAPHTQLHQHSQKHQHSQTYQSAVSAVSPSRADVRIGGGRVRLLNSYSVGSTEYYSNFCPWIYANQLHLTHPLGLFAAKERNERDYGTTVAASTLSYRCRPIVETGVCSGEHSSGSCSLSPVRIAEVCDSAVVQQQLCHRRTYPTHSYTSIPKHVRVL